MTSTTEQQAEPLCRCHACGNVFVLPALAQCPSCASRQVGRIDPNRAALRDALAVIDNLILEHASFGERLVKVQATLWKVVRGG